MTRRSAGRALTALVLVGCAAAALFSSYALATAGEPQSAWLWGNVLGLAAPATSCR